MIISRSLVRSKSEYAYMLLFRNCILSMRSKMTTSVQVEEIEVMDSASAAADPSSPEVLDSSKSGMQVHVIKVASVDFQREPTVVRAVSETSSHVTFDQGALDSASHVKERLQEALVSKQWQLVRKYLEIVRMSNPTVAAAARDLVNSIALEDQQSSILSICTLFGQYEAVTTLLEIGININALDKHNRSALHICAMTGSVDIMKLLISHGADAAIVDKDGCLPLHIACKNRLYSDVLISLLLPVSGTDARLQYDKEGFIPLWYAVETKSTSTLRRLLSNLADEQLSYQNMFQEGDTLVHLLIRRKETGMAKILIESGTPVNLQNDKGETLLHLVALTGNADLLESLRRHQVKTDLRNESGYLPLQIAVVNGDADFLHHYFKTFPEASLNERTKDGQTLAHMAAAKGYAEVLEVLKRNGLSFSIPDKAGMLPLHTAVLMGDEKTISAVIKFVPYIDIPTRDGYTALHLAASKGKHDAIDILMGRGANVDANDGPYGETALHLAAKLETEYLPAFNLVMSGANVNLLDAQGQTPLHVAAASGNAAVAALLLKENASCQIGDTTGNTALHIACLCGDIQVTRVILDRAISIENNTSHSSLVHVKNKRGETPLHCVCRSNIEMGFNFRTEDVAQLAVLLLNSGATVNARTNEDWKTPVHYVAEFGNYGVLVALLNNLSDLAVHTALHMRTKKGLSPLMLAAEVGNISIVELLLERKARTDVFDEEGRAALHLAAAHGFRDIVFLLLRYRAFVNARTKSGLTAMHLAARRGSKEIVDLLLDHAAIQDTMSIHKKTPLHYAAESGSVDVCRQLLQLGSNPAAKDEYGSTPLHLASSADAYEVLDLFMELPAGLKLLMPTDWNGLNVAHTAAQHGSEKFITKLLNIDRVFTMQSRIHGTESTALHLAAVNGHSEIVRILLDAGADATQENKEGFNPLHLAAKAGNFDVLRELKKYITLKTCSMKTGLSAVHIAAYYGQLNFIREISEHVPMDVKSEQPTVNNSFVKETSTEPGLTALHFACSAGQDDVIRFLLTFPECDPNAISTTTGSVPFHFSAKSGNIAGAHLLLGRADVNIADHKGRTALMFAAISGNVEFCQLLMEHGGDVTGQDQNGFTALHFSASAGKLDLVKLLLDHNAQPESRTKTGRTPLKMAVSARQLDTVRFLLKQPYNSMELAEDREFLYDLMICSKLARQRPLEEFILHSQSPVEIALKITEFYHTASSNDREYEHDLLHSSYFCSTLTYDILQIACEKHSPAVVFQSYDIDHRPLAELILDGDHKHLSALPELQTYVKRVWLGFQSWSWKRICLIFLTLFVCPVLWAICSLLLGYKYADIPLMKYICNLVSHLYFMILLVLVLMSPFVPLYQRADNRLPTSEEYILLLWILGRVVYEITVRKTTGERGILRKIIAAVCVAAVIVNICGFFVHSNYIFATLLYIRNEVLALVFLLATLQLLSFLVFHHTFGPMRILLAELGLDLVQFFGILIPFIFGCTFLCAALYVKTKRPRQAHDTDAHYTNATKRARAGHEEREFDILQIITKLYFSLYDRITQPEFAPANDGPVFADTLIEIFHMTYLMMAVIVILKILVATFTNTYKRVQSRSDVEWKHGRAGLVLSTEKSLLTPPPLNLLLLPILVSSYLCHREDAAISEAALSSKSSGSSRSINSEGSHHIRMRMHPHHVSRKSIASIMVIGSRQWSRRIRSAGRIHESVDWKAVVAEFHQRYLSKLSY